MSNEKSICPICGEPTNVYMGKTRKDRLCRKHGMQANKGELVQCPDCKEWNNAEEICSCKKTTSKTVVKELPKDNASELTCIICGEQSNGKHFCLNCYKEFKDHSVDIRITNCRDTEIIDKYGNRKIKTKDGRFVRSLSEKIILDYFFDHFIRVVYEKTIPYINEKGENAELHPDFYLQDFDLYIEFNGLKNKTYLRKKDYVNKIYSSKGFKVEFLDSDGINDIECTLEQIFERHKK